MVASDMELIAHLTDEDFVVTIKTDTTVTAADFGGKLAALLSGSTTAATLLKTVPELPMLATPMIVMDEDLQPLLNMTAAGDDAHNTTQGAEVEIPEDAAEELTGGAEEVVAVYNMAFDLGWGVPGPDALRGATVVGIPNQLVTYGYEAGDAMVNNTTAPAKRVFYFLQDANIMDLLSEDGLDMFEAVVEFVTED